MNKTEPKTARYGIDGPTAIHNFLFIGVALIIIGIIQHDVFTTSSLSTYVMGLLILIGIFYLSFVGLMLRSSIFVKFRIRENIIDALNLRGDETVLDIGCGRGLLLNAAAKRLSTGRAIGLDLWRSNDQSGNRPEITLANAQAEGVANRVEVKTGDMRNLPFEDRTIDVVVSSLAIHNIPSREDRAKAIREISRVLKPDGKIAILDYSKTNEYIKTLHDIGWTDTHLSGLYLQMTPPVRLVTGVKPNK